MWDRLYSSLCFTSRVETRGTGPSLHKKKPHLGATSTILSAAHSSEFTLSSRCSFLLPEFYYILLFPLSLSSCKSLFILPVLTSCASLPLLTFCLQMMFVLLRMDKFIQWAGVLILFSYFEQHRFSVYLFFPPPSLFLVFQPCMHIPVFGLGRAPYPQTGYGDQMKTFDCFAHHQQKEEFSIVFQFCDDGFSFRHTWSYTKPLYKYDSKTLSALCNRHLCYSVKEKRCFTASREISIQNCDFLLIFFMFGILFTTMVQAPV